MGSAKQGRLRLGTCSWSTADWSGKVYGADTPKEEYIREYAARYSTVEADSTFYGTPRATTVEGWRDRTPPEFVFSVKAPQRITHEKFLDNCDEDLARFLDTMRILGPRLGPVVFQFPYYSKKTGVTKDAFVARLGAFLAKAAAYEQLFTVEVRNKAWIDAKLLRLLADHGVSLALIDHPWMAPPEQLFRKDGVITGRFLYVRWLGDRYAIEEITKTWGEHVIDRGPDLDRWVSLMQTVLERGVDVYGYVNNHYSGYAPGDVDRLIDRFGLVAKTPPRRA